MIKIQSYILIDLLNNYVIRRPLQASSVLEADHHQFYQRKQPNQFNKTNQTNQSKHTKQTKQTKHPKPPKPQM